MLEYFGLLALIGVGCTAALFLSLLARRLRTRVRDERTVIEEPRATAAHDVEARAAHSNSRYFLLAVVGLALHAGAFYFYLWGASVRTAGLPGLLVMVMLGFCLITGVFYSWARGTVSYARANPSASEASNPSD